MEWKRDNMAATSQRERIDESILRRKGFYFNPNSEKVLDEAFTLSPLLFSNPLRYGSFCLLFV
jgi:hypothetical protein